MGTSSPAALDKLADALINDMGAALGCALARIGDRLGLYRALRTLGRSTPDQLAAKTHLSPRMVREWLVAQAAAGYIEYDSKRGEYFLSEEQAALLADEDSPRFLLGGFQFATALVKAEERIAQTFHGDDGMSWSEQHADLAIGVGRFLKPGYLTELASTWIPAVPDLAERLRAGATVADVGCGFGYSTIALAQGFPNATIHGFDSHTASIDSCIRLANDHGVFDRVRFEAHSAAEIPDHQYDVIAFFNALHDMGTPVRALAQARRVMKADGFLLLTEPMAGHTIEDNFNPVGRVMSASSVLCCTPHGLADGGAGLGTLATDAQLRAVALAAGFRTFERVHESKYTRVFVGRP
jgi:SAM-dependent methyltransferase